MGAALMDKERQAEQRTDMTKVIGAFRYCTNAPKTRKLCRFYNKNKRSVFIPHFIFALYLHYLCYSEHELQYST